MPRQKNKVPSVKISGYVSENFIDPEIVKYIKNKKADLGDAKLLREMTVAYYNLQTGRLVSVDVLKNLDKPSETKVEKADDPEEEVEIKKATVADAMDVLDDFE